MPYFHVVFTVPEEIEVIAFQNQAVVYDILFRAASETLRTIAADPKHLGAEIGFLAVLHTWGQNLCTIRICTALYPAAGSHLTARVGSPAGRDSSCRSRVLSRMFRGLFLHYLEKAFAAGELNFFSAYRHLHEPAAFRRYLAPVSPRRMGGLCEAALRRAGPGSRLCRAVYPSRRHLQQPAGVHRQRQGPLPLEGLPGWQPPEDR